MERRLAAILATDVVGYSRLMENDDEGTVATLKERRKTLFEPAIGQHRGHIVKLMGDGALVEFPSVVAALRCAIAVQRLNERENETLLESRAIRLRMGIDIGDVLVDEGDIFGTGVNVAARLQGIAEPGGICISAAAREQTLGQPDLAFRYRGDHELHNIAEPIRVYDVDPTGATTPSNATLRSASLPLPDRPSIAVLPFESLGRKSDQRYFSDGMTRDIITELSRFRSLFVVAANSSFRFRRDKRDQARVGRELGVRYLVDGSVQRLGRQLSVTVQLVDALTGLHVWGERYSHDIEDPTAIQQTLVQSIASQLHNRLEHAELAIARRRPPASLRSYELWLQGNEWHESSAPDGYQRARRYYERAIAADPAIARAYASLAEIAYMESLLASWGREDEDAFKLAGEFARRAIALDSHDANGHAMMAWVLMYRRQFAKAMRHWGLATTLNPNDADILMSKATALAYLGQPDEGAEAAKAAMRLNPLHPDWYLSDYAVVLFFARRFEEMLSIYDIIPELFPHTPGWRAAAHAHLGQMAEARDHAAAFTRNIAAIWAGSPDATPQDYGSWFVRCSPMRRHAEREIMETGLRLAGLHE